VRAALEAPLRPEESKAMSSTSQRPGNAKLPRLHWEDFDVGDVFAAPWGRTITDAYLLAFAGINGDFQHMHVDELYAGATEFGGRIAHGNLTAAQGLGMQIYTQVFHHVIALLEERHVYTGAVRVGDTVFSTMTVTDSRPTRKPDRGVLLFRNDLTNQHEKLVCESHYTMMMRRRPSA
jgi:acyl dehydratase